MRKMSLQAKSFRLGVKGRRLIRGGKTIYYKVDDN